MNEFGGNNSNRNKNVAYTNWWLISCNFCSLNIFQFESSQNIILIVGDYSKYQSFQLVGLLAVSWINLISSAGFKLITCYLPWIISHRWAAQPYQFISMFVLPCFSFYFYSMLWKSPSIALCSHHGVLNSGGLCPEVYLFAEMCKQMYTFYAVTRFVLQLLCDTSRV